MPISLIKQVKELAASADIKKNSHYVFTDGKGNLRAYFNDICYARLRSECGITKIRIFFNQHKRDTVNKNSFKRWFNWIVKESFWKDAFLNIRNWEKEGISLNCNLPLAYIGGAATALREGYEYPVATNAWCQMVDAGIHPAIAHCFSNYYNSLNDKGCYERYGNKGHHGAISNNITLKGVVEYAKGNSAGLPSLKPARKSAGSFYGIWNLFPQGAYNDYPVLDIVKKSAIKKGKGWQTEEFYTLSEETINNILAFQKEYLP
jgi:hypothetical protein